MTIVQRFSDRLLAFVAVVNASMRIPSLSPVASTVLDETAIASLRRSTTACIPVDASTPANAERIAFL
jgi:hypothetical protein